ncbi:hypothetical protein K0M31_009454 [Melipona bicolor]|uniref:Uncharacterized protein n=1 Tax=Melipona bicolor TaxID=60889 RepID=A0AA40FNL1_9HYME|nr:hypothetical protein K0M31_009454 [Melipona bicolor]
MEIVGLWVEARQSFARNSDLPRLKFFRHATEHPQANLHVVVQKRRRQPNRDHILTANRSRNPEGWKANERASGEDAARMPRGCRQEDTGRIETPLGLEASRPASSQSQFVPLPCSAKRIFIASDEDVHRPQPAATTL